jgi:hypothetical protein
LAFQCIEEKEVRKRKVGWEHEMRARYDSVSSSFWAVNTGRCWEASTIWRTWGR